MNEEEKDDPIGKALGVSPMTSLTPSVSNIIAEAHNDSAKIDFETARSNIHTIIENGSEAIYKLSQIADSSQNPRAFEVLSKLIDSMLQANKDLLDLQTKIREINSADAPMSEKARTINNSIFVGSTTELQKIINVMKQPNMEEIDEQKTIHISNRVDKSQ